MRTRPAVAILVPLATAVIGCGPAAEREDRSASERSSPVPRDPCTGPDPVLAGSSFVVATAPRPGAVVRSGFAVRGCSRTFESTVVWRLLARDGSALAEGHTMGGGVDGPGPFAFTVAFTVDEAQLGHLEVVAPDPSGGEGYPPGRTILPLVLRP